MRKVALGVAVSLDGYIEGPNGEYDWCFNDQDYGLSEFMKRIDGIFMGRKSYEISNAYEGPNPWKDVKTYVFSNTLETVSENAEIVRGNINKIVLDLKKQPGKDLWLFGGADLTTSFVNANLVDEFWLAIHPVILGSGKPLFSNIQERMHLTLKSHQVYNTGLVSVCYTRAEV
jgi:dihydrofolate reductase